MDKKNNQVIEKESIKVASITVLDKEENNHLPVHEYTDLDIHAMIYEIRGQQVMLDSDLAKLYGYEVKQFNRQVKRNIERFPKDFMFQLIEKEIGDLMRCQFGTSSKDNMFKGQEGGRRYLPFAFTEQGIYMLAAVLKSEIAICQSILIIRTFKEMRHFLIENRQLLSEYDMLKIEHRLHDNEQAICKVENSMANKDDIHNLETDIQNIMDNFIVNDKTKEFAFLKGQQFEADELFIKIYSEAKHSIYIIDNYVSIKILSHLKHKRVDVEVVIFTSNLGGRDKLGVAEYDDFNTQYPSLVLKPNNLSHDRYIILDYNTENEKIYHSGASIKDAGKKVCGVNEITNTKIYHVMIDELMLQKDVILS